MDPRASQEEAGDPWAAQSGAVSLAWGTLVSVQTQI